MTASPSTQAAMAYADGIRARLPQRLRDALAAAGLSQYALWQECGVTRDTLWRIDAGLSIPDLHITARMAHGMGLTLAEFVEPLG